MKIHHLSPVACVSALALTAPLTAATQHWQCVVQPSSTYSQSTRLQIPLAGTWIGNYDAVTNPTGTQTRPGFFGGSGNNAIPFSSVVKPTISISNTHPTGAFELSFDQSTGVLEVNKLSLDVLAGQAGTISTAMVLTYSTFRSIAPNSTFIGLTNVEVPVDSGSLTAATAVQSGAAFGTATAGPPQSWTFAVSVPVTVTATGVALGQPFTNAGPAVMVLSGTINIVGTTMTIVSQGTVQDNSAVPAAPPLVNAPFDLPTVLPSGQIAHLLINGTFAVGTSSTTVTSDLAINGALIPVFGDLNGDGVVNGADLGLLLANWGQPGSSDLNHDGTTNGADLGLLLASWTS